MDGWDGTARELKRAAVQEGQHLNFFGSHINCTSQVLGTMAQRQPQSNQRHHPQSNQSGALPHTCYGPAIIPDLSSLH